MKLPIVFVAIVALLVVALMPVDMALAQQANPDRTLPDTVERGETFDVTVTFTASADDFNAIGLTDLAPDGWDVQLDKTWCTPNAKFINATGDKAEIMWFGPHAKDTSFSAMYKVTVTDYAWAGIHTFDGSLEYYLGEEGPYVEDTTGDSEVEVPLSTTPLISCSPKSFSFSATQGGSNPAGQTLEIWNSGIGTISWTLSDNAAWLSQNPTSGSSTSERDTVAVSVNIAGMSVGDYSTNIVITAGGASNSPWTVPVSLHISSAASAASQISFKPESLSFTAVEGGSNPANQILDVWNSGGGTMIWRASDDANWLGESPISGSSTGEHDRLTVLIVITDMSRGDYSANITITADGASNSPQKVPVSLHISSAAPQISFSPESLSFTAVEGGSNPANETLEIWNSGVETLHWILSDDAEWLSESPTSGSSMSERDTVVLSVDTTGMSAGNYSANMIITADGAGNSPQVVVVGLYIASASPPSPPPPSSAQPWLNQYWWTIVAGIVGVVVLIYLLRRRRGA